MGVKAETLLSQNVNLFEMLKVVFYNSIHVFARYFNIIN